MPILDWFQTRLYTWLIGGFPGSAPVWERNMGSHGHDDKGPEKFLTSYCKTNSGDDGAEGRRLGMVVGLGGSGA